MTATTTTTTCAATTAGRSAAVTTAGSAPTTAGRTATATPPRYSWENGGWQRTVITSRSDDVTSGAIDFGFNFRMYGQSYSRVYIGSNGTMTFGSDGGNACCNGQRLPTNYANLENQPMVAAFWGDIDYNTVQWKTVGNAGSRRFIYQHSGREYSAGTTVRFQVVLFEGSNQIQVNIQNAQYTRRSLSIGIQRNAQTALQAIYQASGQVSRYTNYAIRFTPLI